MADPNYKELEERALRALALKNLSNVDKCDRFKNKLKLFITMGLGENLPISTCHEAEDDDYLDDLLEIGRTKTQRVLEDGYLRFSNLKKIFCAFKNSVDV